jgi:hypothetical protein
MHVRAPRIVRRLPGPLRRDALPVAGVVLVIAVTAEAIGRIGGFIALRAFDPLPEFGNTRLTDWTLAIVVYLVIAVSTVLGRRLPAALGAWVMVGLLASIQWSHSYALIWDGWHTSMIWWRQSEEIITPLVVALTLSFVDIRRGCARLGRRGLVAWTAAIAVVCWLATFTDGLGELLAEHGPNPAISTLTHLAVLPLAAVAVGIAVRSALGRVVALAVTPPLAMPLADTVFTLYGGNAALAATIVALTVLAFVALLVRRHRESPGAKASQATG